jgi:hypothetical protein
MISKSSPFSEGGSQILPPLLKGDARVFPLLQRGTEGDFPAPSVRFKLGQHINFTSIASLYPPAKREGFKLPSNKRSAEIQATSPKAIRRYFNVKDGSVTVLKRGYGCGLWGRDVPMKIKLLICFVRRRFQKEIEVGESR